MRLVIRWGQESSKRGSPALLRFREVLSSAAETHYYRPWLEAARLLHNGKLGSLSTLSEALACVPRVEMEWFLHHQNEFKNRRARNESVSRLDHASDPAPRTAIFATNFEQTGNIRCLDRGDLDSILKFGPECIAGPIETLLHLARGVRRGRFALPTIRHSIVVFSDLRGGLLPEGDRDSLWDAFRVPVFEQLRGLGAELLAAECEAHNGLHLCARDAVMEFDTSRHMPELLFTSLADLAQPCIRLATGWSPQIDDRICGCGSSRPRLMSLVAVEQACTLARAAAC
jgi:hypothetical protein